MVGGDAAVGRPSCWGGLALIIFMLVRMVLRVVRP